MTANTFVNSAVNSAVNVMLAAIRGTSTFAAARLLCCGIAVTCCLAEARAAGQQPEAAIANNQPAAADQQDDAAATADDSDYTLVFLAERRPVFMRLKASIDERSLQQVWHEYMGQAFAYLDVNQDARIDQTELSRLPTSPANANSYSRPNNLLELIARRLNGSQTSDPQVSAWDRDGFIKKMRVDEPPLRAKPHWAPFEHFDRQWPIWNRVDGDGDGQISKQELGLSSQSLMQLDADSNDLVTHGELSQFSNPFSARRQTYAAMADNDASSPLLLIESRAEAAAAVERMFLMYAGVAEDQRIIPASPEVVARADKDANNDVSDEEWIEYLLAPDAEVLLEINLVRPKPASGDVVLPTPDPSNQKPRHQLVWRHVPQYGLDDWQVISSEMDNLVVYIGGSKLRFTMDNSEAMGIAELLVNQFDYTDADDNQYVDAAESRNNGYFANLFARMDIDGDRKVFLEEVRAFSTRVEGILQSRMEMHVTRRGRHLFVLLDGDDDYRLAPQELQMASQVFDRWDRNANGAIIESELPDYCVLSWSFAKPGDGFPIAYSSTLPAAAGTGAQQNVPDWFRQLDRNGDGDVSAREYPGPVELFQQLDVDNNGWISASEVEPATPP